MLAASSLRLMLAIDPLSYDGRIDCEKLAVHFCWMHLLDGGLGHGNRGLEMVVGFSYLPLAWL